LIFSENDWFFLSFFASIGVSVNGFLGKSNNILDDCSWNLDRCKTLPQETVEEVDEDLRSDLISISDVLSKAFAHGISQAIEISKGVRWSNELWEDELERLSYFVRISSETNWGLSVEICSWVIHTFEFCESL
jgi:hypothetical protein